MISPVERRERRGLSLSRMTTARVGGFAERFHEPASMPELSELIVELRSIGVPFYILGGGTNVLVQDGSFGDAVVCTRRLCRAWWQGERVRVESGMPMMRLVRQSAKHGLSGLEPMAGIPGTAGGAIFGNAGGKHGAIGDVVEWVKVAQPDGRIGWWDRLRVNPGYRRTDLEGCVVLEAVVRLHAAPGGAIAERIREIREERIRSQPRAAGTMGCFFKNPPGRSAGLLIDRAGLKGARVGGVRVSEKHANFLVNGGHGTARDFLQLAQMVQDEVEARFAVRLEPEVRIWSATAAPAGKTGCP